MTRFPGAICWGASFEGESNPAAGTLAQISAGWQHTCGLRADGSSTCWGYNSYGQATVPAGTFTQISAGWQHTCGLRADRSVTCWGDLVAPNP